MFLKIMFEFWADRLHAIRQPPHAGTNKSFETRDNKKFASRGVDGRGVRRFYSILKLKPAVAKVETIVLLSLEEPEIHMQ